MKQSIISMSGNNLLDSEQHYSGNGRERGPDLRDSKARFYVLFLICCAAFGTFYAEESLPALMTEIGQVDSI